MSVLEVLHAEIKDELEWTNIKHLLKKWFFWVLCGK